MPGSTNPARRDVLGGAELLTVAESTSNQPLVAHKGSRRVDVSARGRTAHSSMPKSGKNAISKIAVCKLTALSGEHPLLGSTTAVMTAISGGKNIALVPDLARLAAAFQSLPDDHKSILGRPRNVSAVALGFAHGATVLGCFAAPTFNRAQGGSSSFEGVSQLGTPAPAPAASEPAAAPPWPAHRAPRSTGTGRRDLAGPARRLARARAEHPPGQPRATTAQGRAPTG
ncbi:hypothetical protein D9599_29225 [Roseomonas sp. KE2513]|nr:hypothetical protein [Roseomonas sp. KE2513]